MSIAKFSHTGQNTDLLVDLFQTNTSLLNHDSWMQSFCLICGHLPVATGFKFVLYATLHVSHQRNNEPKPSLDDPSLIIFSSSTLLFKGSIYPLFRKQVSTRDFLFTIRFPQSGLFYVQLYVWYNKTAQHSTLAPIFNGKCKS